MLPAVPTAVEAGVDGLVLESWIGLFAPSKTPQPIVAQLRAAVERVMANQELRMRLETAGWRIIAMSRDDTDAFVRSENAKWSQFIRLAGIRAE